MFSQKISYRHQLITGVGIAQTLIYMCLLTITCLHNKAAVVTTPSLTTDNSEYADYATD